MKLVESLFLVTKCQFTERFNLDSQCSSGERVQSKYDNTCHSVFTNFILHQSFSENMYQQQQAFQPQPHFKKPALTTGCLSCLIIPQILHKSIYTSFDHGSFYIQPLQVRHAGSWSHILQTNYGVLHLILFKSRCNSSAPWHQETQPELFKITITN